MKNYILRIGSRTSPLALIQVQEIVDLLKTKGTKLNFQQIPFKTTGDINQKISLTKSNDEDFFTDSIDKALLNKKIDIAIHSAKDLPQKIHDDLDIFALTKSIDSTDSFIGQTNLKSLKPGAKIGTSSILRRNELLKINPRIKIVDIRGPIHKRIELIDQGICDGIIVATAALKRLKLTDHIKDIMPWEATALQGQLAIVGRKSDFKLKELFKPIDVRTSYGSVYLVGAGPGDPELITQKAIRILKTADCVFYDFLTDPALLKYAPKAERIYAGKRKGEHSLPQKDLSFQLKEKALKGKTVVRLKGGDPLIFGRGAEEIEYLKSYHIPVYIIPGVSSATAIPSSLGIPLTARGISSSVAFLSAHSEEEHTPTKNSLSIPKADTLVFLMGLTKLNIIVKSLLKQGWAKETKAMVISKGTRKDQQIVSGSLKNIETLVKKSNISAPALIIVGEIIKYYTPQQEKTILYTGTNPKTYQSYGRIINFPMIAIKENKLPKQTQIKLLQDLKTCEIILITSRFGALYFFKALQQNKATHDLIKQKNIITIGEESAKAIKEAGFSPSLVSIHENSQSLFNEIKVRFKIKNKTILFPRSSLPNPFLKNNLRKMGGRVKEYAVYQNIMPTKRKLPNEPIDTIIFTSPSQVKNFINCYGTIPSSWQILAKGPLTLQAIKSFGYKAETL